MHIRSDIDTVLFDLDGTLVPMDIDVFTKAYFAELSKKAAALGSDPDAVVPAVWAATKAMFKNDGKITNCDLFWNVFEETLGVGARDLKPPFDVFYSKEFDRVKTVTGENPFARRLVDFLKEKGYTVVLATNPLFPLDGNLTRLGWVGLKEEDFAYITSYENSSYCKPNPKYYRQILEHIGKKPEECIMVGNDVTEDMCAGDIGMDTYLVTDCVINSAGRDIGEFRHGSFEELLAFMGAGL